MFWKRFTRVPAIEPEDLQRLYGEAARLLIIDLRSAAEYQAAHLPGAVNISVDELSARLEGVGAAVPKVLY